MSEMIERVAKALIVSRFGQDAMFMFLPVPPEFDPTGEKQLKFIARIDEARVEARAAIKAMREPSGNMKLEGVRSIGRTMGQENHNVRSRDCWQAMIDDALEET